MVFGDGIRMMWREWSPLEKFNAFIRRDKRASGMER